VGLGTALEAGAARDSAAGFTRQGPHRADLVLRVRGRGIEKQLSRGEIKLLAAALAIAQARAVRAARGEPPVMLVDDLYAELDRGNADRLLTSVVGEGGQVLLTVLDQLAQRFEGAGITFHVERGKVREVV
jgi:DNA replication and repair protein RecF